METKNNTNANKSRKAIRIVISILVAIALWVYVDRGLSVEVTMKVKTFRWSSPAKILPWRTRI